MFKFSQPETHIIIFSNATAQQSPQFVIREDTTPNFHETLLNFFIDTKNLIKEARKEMRGKYPKLLV